LESVHAKDYLRCCGFFHDVWIRPWPRASPSIIRYLVTLRPLLGSFLEFLFGSIIKLVLVGSGRCFGVLASGRPRRFLRFHHVIEVGFVMRRGHLHSIP
jgi:hypothetical protein